MKRSTLLRKGTAYMLSLGILLTSFMPVAAQEVLQENCSETYVDTLEETNVEMQTHEAASETQQRQDFVSEEKGEQESAREEKGEQGSASEAQGEQESAREEKGEQESASEAQGEQESASEAQGEQESVREAQGEQESAREAQGEQESAREAQGEQESASEAQGEQESAREAQGEQESASEEKGEQESAREERGEQESVAETQDTQESIFESSAESESSSSTDEETEAQDNYVGRSIEELENAVEQTYYSEAILSQDAQIYESWKQDAKQLTVLPAQHEVYVIALVLVDEEPVWAHIIFDVDDYSSEGYVSVEELEINGEMGIMMIDDTEDFPEDYKIILDKLHAKHPNWIFKPIYVGDTYSYAVSKQMETPAAALVTMDYNEAYRSLLARDYNWRTNTWKEWEPNWAGASEDTVRYYMDPRNFLNEDNIFMFEALTYEGYQTEETVEAVLEGGFMSHAKVPGEKYTYAWLFVWIGKKYNINPVALASRVRQEQGAGTSDLISGKYPGYEGLYNYFNIQATGSTRDEIIKNGLKEAKTGSTITLPNGTVSEGRWNTPAKALIGGSLKFANRYILRNQNTLYAQKFDYDGEYDGKYWHQYMTNITAPYTEGYRVKTSYQNTGQFESSFVFYIPIYENRPVSSLKPTEHKNANSCINSITVNGKEVISNFDKDQKDFYYNIESNVKSITIKVKAAASSAEVSLDDSTLVSHKVEVRNIRVTAANGTKTDYRLIIGCGVEIKDGFFDGFDPYSYKGSYPGLEKIYGSDLSSYYEHYFLKKPIILNVSISNLTSSGYKVTAKFLAPLGVERVYMPTWTNENGQDDIKWYAAKVSNGSATYTVSTKNHNNEKGMYHTHVYVYDKEGNFTLYPVTVTVPNLAEPAVTVGNVENGVRVKWNVISGAKGYYVYHRKKGEGWGESIATVTGTAYTDSSVTSGTDYYYTVRAYNGNEKSDFKSSSQIRYLAVPTVSMENAVGGVKITWNVVSGAQGYYVYHREAGGSWKRLAAVTDTTYLDTTVTSGTSYDFTVRAYYGGSRSTYQPTSMLTYLASPAVQVKNVSGGISVTWDSISGAKGYYVYHRKKGEGWERIAKVTGTAYTDSSVTSGTVYYYTVRAYNGTTRSLYKSSTAVLRADSIASYVPSVSVSNVSTGIQVKWNVISGAMGYYVYRKTTGGWERITKVTGTAYTDSSVTSGTDYYYTVRAYNGNEKSSYESSSQIRYLAVPTVSMENAVGGVKITWNVVSGAQGYYVYHRESGGSWKRLAAVTDTTYLDTTVTSGTSYDFTVRAYYGGSRSTYQPTSMLTYLASPTVQIKNVSGGISVTWNSISGAKGYYVYHRKKGGNWERIASVKGTSYVDAKVVSGTVYYYTVRAYSDTTRSLYQSSTAILRTDSIASYVPSVSVSNVSTGIQVKWNVISGARGYYVYRKTTGDWKRIATVTGTAYTDSSVTSGTDYYYTVRAYNGDEKSGYKKSSQIRYLAVPTVTASNTTNGIAVTWNVVTGASGYYVYHRKANGSWERIASMRGNSYLDKNVTAGTNYYYTVRAYCGSDRSAYKSTSAVKRTK